MPGSRPSTRSAWRGRSGARSTRCTRWCSGSSPTATCPGWGRPATRRGPGRSSRCCPGRRAARSRRWSGGSRRSRRRWSRASRSTSWRRWPFPTVQPPLTTSGVSLTFPRERRGGGGRGAAPPNTSRSAPQTRRSRRDHGGPLMDDAPRHRTGGRAGRQAARAHRHIERVPFLTRTLAPFEVLDEEGLGLIEHNADTILEEVGLDFRGDPVALRLLHEAGADVDGERVRFPRGMCRQIVQATAPRQFTQHARNPANSVQIGGPHIVFAPNYGSPFVRDLDTGRRYGTLEDFRNFVKLAYLSPHLHHSGGTVCEPVDVPVNKRHFDMVYSHMRYSDKPFMGPVGVG